MSKLNGVQHQNWNDILLEELTDGITRQMTNGDKAMVARLTMAEGSVVPKHHHHNEQVTVMISGVLKFKHGDNLEAERTAKAGDIIITPENVPHEVTAMEDSVALDIFAPPRQDWLDGTADYFNK